MSSGPVPISAVFNPLGGSLVVTFDLPLQADPALDVGNWEVVYAGNKRNIVSAAAAGSAVTVVTTAGDPDVRPNQVSYDPPPYDVLGSDGSPAAAFASFPVT